MWLCRKRAFHSMHRRNGFHCCIRTCGTVRCIDDWRHTHSIGCISNDGNGLFTDFSSIENRFSHASNMTSDNRSQFSVESVLCCNTCAHSALVPGASVRFVCSSLDFMSISKTIKQFGHDEHWLGPVECSFHSCIVTFYGCERQYSPPVWAHTFNNNVVSLRRLKWMLQRSH